MRKITLMLVLFVTTILACSATQSREEVTFDKFAPASEAAVSSEATRISLAKLSSESNYKVGELSAKAKANATSQIRKAPKKVSATDVAGSRYVLSHPQNGLLRVSSATVTKVTDDSVAISGFIYSDVTIGAKINADGSVSIAPQWVANVSEQPVWIVTVDTDKGVYSTTDALVGSVENGNINITSTFGFFVVDGAQKGSYLTVGIQTYADVASANGALTNQKITFNNALSTNQRKVTAENDWIYVHQVNSDQVRLSHLPSNYGYVDLTAKLNYDGTLSIDPQAVYTNTFGTVYNSYKFTETVKDTTITISAQVLSPIEGTVSTAGDSTKISTGRWMIASTGAGIVNLFESSEFRTTASFVFPTKPVFALEGEGTEASPYLIKSAEDFKTLAVTVNSDATYRGSSTTDIAGVTYYPVFAGKYFAIANDIDFSALNGAYTPIGNSTYRFAGYLDGKNYTIKKFRIDEYAYDYVGLFGTIAPSATVKNVKFSSPRVVTVGYNAGILSGRNYGTVDNVSLDSAVIRTTGYNVGLIGGYNFGTISNVKVTTASVTGLGYLGTVAGFSYGNITNSTVEGGTIRLNAKQQFAGGIVGYSGHVNGQANNKVTDCSFSGTIYSSMTEICLGGIAGEIAYTDVERCFTAARILSGSSIQNYIAGLIGAVYASNVTDCYATGVVDNANSTAAAGLISESAETASTGVGTKVTNCYAAVELSTASTDSIAGLIGETEYITWTNCYFDTQMAGFTHSEVGKTTAELTSANGISGFDSNVWEFTEGLYPRIKSADTTNVSAVSSAPVIFAQNDNVRLVKSDFKYSTANGVTWRAIYDGTFNSERGYAFTLNNGDAKLTYEQYTDTVEVRKGAAFKYIFVNVAPMPFNGEGTAASPWEIGTRDEMNQFINISNNATLSFTGKFIKVIADIDMQGDTVKPIDNDDSGKLQFLGTFDGNGHTIDNFVCTTAGFYGEGNSSGKPADELNPRSDQSTYYGGLFGTVGLTGVVKNVTIGPKAVYHLFSYGGAIAGQSYGLIEDCSNYGTIYTYFSRSGGIVGQLNSGSVVRGCYNAGKVYADDNQAGGIAGYATGATIENCQNSGEVGAVYFNSYRTEGNQIKAGGIVGESLAKTVISNVVNTGKVISYEQVGGIAGVSTNTTINNAVNYGDVVTYKSKAKSGHIAGVNTNSTFNNVYYAKQINKIGAVANGNIDGVSGYTTTALAAGNIATLPDSIWKQVAGNYPVLAFAADKAEAKLAAEATVFFDDADFAVSVKKAANLGNTNTVTWTLKKNNGFNIANGALVPTVPESGVSSDTIVASQNGLTRELALSTINSAVLDGEGTAEKPYLIKDSTDFFTLADFISQTGYDYENEYVAVVNNIDFANANFRPITEFAGDFNGRGYTISNIDYVNTASGNTYYALFKTVLASGSVHDIVMNDNNKFGAYNYAAAFVGQLYGNATNLTNKATVTAGASYAAGIVAEATIGSSIKNCHNEANISATTSYAAGILATSAASSSVKIDSCSNSGLITAKTYVAGIASYASAIVSNSNNSGDIIANTQYVGGIIGRALAPSSVYKSYNTATIAGTQYMGGIVGNSPVHAVPARFEIDSCYNTGNIAAIAKGSNVGGIIGSHAGGTSITNSYNTGNIAPDGNYQITNTGGITGSCSSSATNHNFYTNLNNTGKVSGYTGVGGIGGNIAGDTATIINKVYNYGPVSSTSVANANTGGLFGTGGYELSNSYNAGDITAVGAQVGGISGYLTGKPYYFTNVANYGNVTATTAKALKIGGIVGMGRVEMSSCYNFGEVTGYGNVAGIVGFPGNAAAATFYVHIAETYNAGKVTATSGAAGNISNYNSSCNYFSADSIYYDSEINEAGTYDASMGAKGKTKKEFVELAINDNFENAVACYPSLKAFKGDDYNSFAVAMILFAEDEKADSVSHNFTVGVPEGAVWTGTSNLQINGNEVVIKPTSDGESATITLTCGKLTRSYDLILHMPSGVSDNVADKAIVARTYYNIAGIEIAEPTDNSIVIEKTTYSDGTTVARKVVYKAK